MFKFQKIVFYIILIELKKFAVKSAMRSAKSFVKKKKVKVKKIKKTIRVLNNYEKLSQKLFDLEGPSLPGVYDSWEDEMRIDKVRWRLNRCIFIDEKYYSFEFDEEYSRIFNQ